MNINFKSRICMFINTFSSLLKFSPSSCDTLNIPVGGAMTSHV